MWNAGTIDTQMTAAHSTHVTLMYALYTSGMHANAYAQSGKKAPAGPGMGEWSSFA